MSGLSKLFWNLKFNWKNKRWQKEMLAKAKAIKNQLKSNNILSISDYDLYIAANGFFESKKYADSAPFFAELYRRQTQLMNSTPISPWCGYACSLYYYGYGNVPRDLDKAGDLAMILLENDMEMYMSEDHILGVPFDSEKKASSEDRQQLLPVSKDRLERIMDTRLNLYINAIKDHTYETDEGEAHHIMSELFRLFLLGTAFYDLDELNYWQLPRTAASVTKLFQDAANQGNAIAMFWLVRCVDSHILSMSESDACELLKAAANKGYLPAIVLYYGRYNGNLPDAANFKSVVQSAKKEFLDRVLN